MTLPRESDSDLRVCVVEVQHAIPGVTWRWEFAERRWLDLLAKLGELLDRQVDVDGIPEPGAHLPPIYLRIEVRQ